MDNTKCPEEVRDSMIQAMGPEIGNLYYELWNDLAWTYARWDEFVALFGSGEEHLQWMNTVAPRCFYQIQTAMWRDILVQICCLSNCPMTSGKTNTSVQALDELLDKDALGARYAVLVADALSCCRFACECRDRACADRDQPMAREHHTDALTQEKRDNVEGALAACSPGNAGTPSRCTVSGMLAAST